MDLKVKNISVYQRMGVEIYFIHSIPFYC